MNKDYINILVVLSIILTIIFPIIGVWPLYYSAKANSEYKNGDEAYVINAKKCYKSLKIGGIAFIIMYVLILVGLIILYHYDMK